MTRQEPSGPKRLKMPAMGQLGMVVEDMQASLGYYATLLNIRPWYQASIVKSEFHYEGRPIELELDIALGYSGALQFELIQVIRGDRNIYSDFISARKQGIHHIGFVVSDIAAKIETMKAAGFEPVQHGVLETRGKAITRFAYFDTIDRCGYITELIQVTLFGINVGMSRPMMKIGRLLGDVRIIKA